MESDTYTTGEAARILGVTETRVRQLLLSGELEGTRDMNERWRIPQHAVHARKEQRTPLEVARRAADAREWIERVNELERELGRMQGRLELTEVAESTLRESLERERERADRLEGRLEVTSEAESALRGRLQGEQARADRLEAELREERSKGFWARLFGG
jgi:excisionase family DNA binding protein